MSLVKLRFTFSITRPYDRMTDFLQNNFVLFLTIIIVKN